MPGTPVSSHHPKTYTLVKLVTLNYPPLTNYYSIDSGDRHWMDGWIAITKVYLYEK